MSLGVYCIKNLINDKVYVGKAIDLSIRTKKHRPLLNRNIHHNPHLQASWNKYGEGNFEVIILEYIENSEDLTKKEKEWMQILNSKNPEYGYNIADSENGMLGHKHSRATKEKMSKNHADFFGKNGPFYGKTHTEEARRKISEAGKGRKHTEEAKAKVSKSLLRNKRMLGKKLSLETKLKLSRALSGENGSNSKLNELQVRIIKRLLEDGSWKHKEIAEIFNVSLNTITSINNGTNWNYLNKIKA